MAQPIYLDHNATTPMLPEVIEAIRACQAGPCRNPASQHASGRQARRELENARDRIGELLGADPNDRIVFTSGGTEANNLAIFGLTTQGTGTKPGHLIHSAIEHPSVERAAAQLAEMGWEVETLGVDPTGVVRHEELPSMLRPETRLVSVILGQNETGVLQPVDRLAAICRERGVPFHADAAQVVGKLPVDFRQLRVATLTVAAHKFHGPVGIGALVVHEDAGLEPQLWGGFQQQGLRPGTESVALAVGMCRALECWHAEQDERIRRMTRLRDQFEEAICAAWPDAIVIGNDATRLPHTSNIAFVGLDRQALFLALDQAGVACSTGSACASGSSEPSPALLAMGLPKAVINGSLRFSLGALTTAAEITEAARRILLVCNQMRPLVRG
jgi:cysteine desulfurase